MTKTKTVRNTDSQKTLSTAEVRRMLYDIGFVLRLSRAIKTEILGDDRKTLRAPVSDDADTAFFVAA